jgi:hypothetical protein
MRMIFAIITLESLRGCARLPQLVEPDIPQNRE